MFFGRDTHFKVYFWESNFSLLQASSRTLNMGVLALTLTMARFASGAITVSDDVDIVTTPRRLFSRFGIQMRACNQNEPELRPAGSKAVWLR